MRARVEFVKRRIAPVPRKSAKRRIPCRQRGRSGAAATEYMLILALVVLPLASLLPLFIKMIRLYGSRMSLMQLPFP